MGYWVAIVDTKRKLFYKSYKKRYDGMAEYADGQNHTVSSQRLQDFFLEFKDVVRPLNGEFAATEGECDSGKYYASDYGFSQDAIWVELTFPDVYERLVGSSRSSGSSGSSRQYRCRQDASCTFVLNSLNSPNSLNSHNSHNSHNSLNSLNSPNSLNTLTH